MPPSILSLFHPRIGTWFSEKIGAPTDIQERAWPEIGKGRHVLVTAPTGCGKTMAAFLWAVNQLVTGAWTGGTVRVLYVSPLKALNNDIQRNLLKPLSELKEAFTLAGETFPEISVLTRSGDTPGEDRRRMIRRPPEILITTPESLNILLCSQSGRAMLQGVATVILDEIHAVAGTKRGTHLITAIDRLVLLSGEFQRIALSATVSPPERVAAFVGGFLRRGKGNDSVYEQRPVSVIRSSHAKSYELKVCFPVPGPGKDSRWPAMIDAFIEVITSHRSTLLFANSRRTTEKVTRMLNEQSHSELAYAHHGSLAKELRLAVEQSLKNGTLRAIVATNSLELGIDIGSLDQVVLVQTPRSVSSALQRIGRSGHGVGETSRGLLFPANGRDLIDAAVTARAMLDQDIEELHPVESPLDVLAQVILSMTAMERWDIDELYAVLKTSYPFRELPRKLFDILLEMLAGRYADTRLRELKPRVSLDRIDNTIEANSGTPYLIYMSGGTIPERGYFDLRLRDSRAKIGELDEEFVWERDLGETFTLGSQLWRIEKITHNDVEVAPARSAAGIIPFWRAEEQDRDFHLSEKIGLFLEHAGAHLDSAAFRQELMTAHAMEEPAADALIGFLKLQKEASGSGLPHRYHLLVERLEEPVNQGGFKQVILHTFWGGRVNRPFALALAQAWEDRERTRLQVVETDDALLLMLPREVSAQDVVGLLSPENVEACLRRKLEQTGFFGARFRENAERAMLLPKSSFKRRMPLWLIRLRAKGLLEAVRGYEDFPILIETWRTCFEDEFDLPNLKKVLEELREGRIRVTETVTRAASPFCAHLVWKQTNKDMYADDTPLSEKESALRPDLIREILFSSQLRPKIPPEVVKALDEKLKRTAPGYAPGSALELLDWIKERLLVPEPEWKELAGAIRRDHDADAAAWLTQQGKKLAWLSWPGVAYPLLSSREMFSRVLVAFRLHRDDVAVRAVSPDEGAARVEERMKASVHGEPAGSEPGEEYDLSTLLASWLAYYGPVPRENLRHLLGVTLPRLDEAIEPLVESQDLVLDRFSDDSRELEVCDSENLARLLRMARRYRQPLFQPLPLDQLPLFLAQFQGIVPRGHSMEDLEQRLEQLFGLPVPVGAWEEYILPARMQQYQGEWLDKLMDAGELLWFGCGQRRISLAFSQDLELFRPPSGTERHGEALDHLIPGQRGRYSFFEIMEHSHLDAVHATEVLWKEAWKGNVTSDTFRTVRKGAITGFTARDFSKETGLASRRSGFNRWKVSRPLEGHWLRIDASSKDQNLLLGEELVKDRIRQLLRRYGVLFRELLNNELPHLQWRSLFRSLRLMELSGELLSGHFFDGPSGMQFLSHEAFRMLQSPLQHDAVYWMNAADPASLCGIGIGPVSGRRADGPGAALPRDIPVPEETALPPRIASTWMVYHGSRLVMVARRLGKHLELRPDPGDEGLPLYFGIFKDQLSRSFKPLQKISVETVNNEPVLLSPYAGALKKSGFRSARNTLELWREL